MLYKCRVCDNYRYSQSSPLWKGVPWIAYLEGDYCCAQCHDDHDGPGKFESCQSSRGHLGKALILYAWSMDSGEDDFMTSDSWGYCGLFGRFLLLEDERGFVSVEEYSTTDKAQQRFDELYEDGMGAQEDVAYVSYDGCGRWSVSFDGKALDVWPSRHTDYITERRCLARVRLEMMRTRYYPNVWVVSDHGNLVLQKG